ANGARRRNTLQSRGDVHAVTHQIAIALLDNISKVNANAEFYPAFRRHTRIALDHCILHLDSAAHGIHYAAELDDGSIAGALDYPTPMDCDGWIDQIAAQRPQPRQSAILIRTGKPAEPNHICRQDSREFPLFGHYLYGSSTTIPITRPYRMRKLLCISL